MTFDTFKERLLGQAADKGICGQGLGILRSCDSAEEMADYYMANPDWCMERGFPGQRELLAYRGVCEPRGLYVGRKFDGELMNERQAYAFIGCRGTIKVALNKEEGIIPMLYLSGGCRMRIVGAGDVKPRKESERSVVPVYTFGKNDVSARDNKYVRFAHYKSELI